MVNISRRPGQSGVSLVELLVALTIGAVIATALAAIFSQSVKSRERVNRESQKIENGRYALDVLADDIRLAGYWGEFTPPPDTQWKDDVSPCATATGLLGWLYNEVTPSVPVPIQGRDGHTTALDASAVSCLANLKTNSNILVLRRVSTVAIAPVGTLPGAAYLQTSSKNLELCGSADTKRFAFSDSVADLNLKWMDCATTARAREFIVRVYYVATCNDCAAADGIPTLKVAELKKVGGVGAVQVRSVVPGIDDFRVVYGVDCSYDALAPDKCVRNGSVDGAYSATDNAGVLLDNDANALSPVKWSDVVSARVFMVVRDIDATPGYANNRTFDLGGATYTASGDAYRRELMSTTVRLVNVAGRRGAP